MEFSLKDGFQNGQSLYPHLAGEDLHTLNLQTDSVVGGGKKRAACDECRRSTTLAPGSQLLIACVQDSGN